MAQRLKGQVALRQNLGSMASIHTTAHTDHNSSPRVSDTCFCPLKALHRCGEQMYIQGKKNSKNLKIKVKLVNVYSLCMCLVMFTVNILDWKMIKNSCRSIEYAISLLSSMVLFQNMVRLQMGYKFPTLLILIPFW